MAVTIGSWSSIDDTEVDAESPITESLMVRNRDNSYWIDAGTRKTSQTSQTKVLVPDGSNGVEWVELNTISGGGANGNIDITTSGQTITAAVLGILRLDIIASHTSGGVVKHLNAMANIDLSDDTLHSISGVISVGSSNSAADDSQSITLTSSYQSLGADVEIRRSGGNVEVKASNATTTSSLLYMIH